MLIRQGDAYNNPFQASLALLWSFVNATLKTLIFHSVNFWNRDSIRMDNNLAALLNGDSNVSRCTICVSLAIMYSNNRYLFLFMQCMHCGKPRRCWISPHSQFLWPFFCFLRNRLRSLGHEGTTCRLVLCRAGGCHTLTTEIRAT